MTWYYALGNERQGPVDDAALDRLVATGVVTQDTLVWKAGMADWQPLSQARPRMAAPPTPVLPPPPAAITPTPAAGAPDTQPRFGTPAPVFTPAPTAQPTPTPTPGAYGAPGGGYGAAGWSQPGAAPSSDPDQLYARIVSEGRTFAIGDVVGRGWQLVMDNFGLAVLTTAVVWIAIIAGGAIPCIGIIVSLVARPVLLGGLFLFFIKLARGQNAEFGDAFAGFSDSFLQLFLQGLVFTVLQICSMIPGGILMFMGVGLSERSEAIGVMLILIGALLSIPPAVYLFIIWVFSLPLIIDKRMDFWPAMELSRKAASRVLLPTLGLMFLCWLMMLGGIVALCLGIFVALPIIFASVTMAYEDMFGDGVRR